MHPPGRDLTRPYLRGVTPPSSSLSFQHQPLTLWAPPGLSYFSMDEQCFSLLSGLCSCCSLCLGQPSLPIHLVNAYSALSWVMRNALLRDTQQPVTCKQGQDSGVESALDRASDNWGFVLPSMVHIPTPFWTSVSLSVKCGGD